MKILLTLILMFVLVGMVMPRLVRWMFRMFLQDQYQKTRYQFDADRQTQQRRQGKVNVDKAPPAKPDYQGGEYIDYEEIK